MNKKTPYHAWHSIAAIAVILIIEALLSSQTRIENIPYSRFQSDLKSGAIESVRVSGNHIQGKFKKPDEKDYAEFVATRVSPEIAQDLEKYHVVFPGALESTFRSNALSWMIPTASALSATRSSARSRTAS